MNQFEYAEIQARNVIQFIFLATKIQGLLQTVRSIGLPLVILKICSYVRIISQQPRCVEWEGQLLCV